MGERLYTVDEAASILRLSPETIRKMIKQNRIDAFKVGLQWRIKQSTIDKHTQS